MSLAKALGQVLADVVKGKKTLIVNLSGPDSAFTTKLVTSLLQDSDCCDSIDSTANQCVARVRPGKLSDLANTCLQMYQKRCLTSPDTAYMHIQTYLHRNYDKPESELLSVLLADSSVSYLLDVFTHFYSLETDHPALPYHCTNVILTDTQGSFLLITFSKSAAHGSGDNIEAFRDAKKAAASSASRFRDNHPHAAVVLAAAYHDQLKLNLLESSQPEALTVIQSLIHLQLSQQGEVGTSEGHPASHATNGPSKISSCASDSFCDSDCGSRRTAQIQVHDIVIPTVIAVLGTAAFFVLRSIIGRRND